MSVAHDIYARRQQFRASIAAHAVRDDGILTRKERERLAEQRERETRAKRELAAAMRARRAREAAEEEQRRYPPDFNVDVVSVNIAKNPPVSLSVIDGIDTSCGAPTIRAIQDAVCKAIGLTRAELLSKRRTRRIAITRGIAFMMCRLLTTKSTIQIAKAFGMDHTSVLYAERKTNRISRELDMTLGLVAMAAQGAALWQQYADQIAQDARDVRAAWGKP